MPGGGRGHWRANAPFWARIIRERLDPFREIVTDDAILSAVGQCRGLRTLDAGCGEGYLARALADQGASIIGLDACAELVRRGSEIEREQSHGIMYLEGDIARLPFRDGSFDVVLFNHSINEVPETDMVIGEAARVLTSGGQLILLFLHPCFYRYRTGTTGRTRSQNFAYRYFRSAKVVKHFLVSGIKSPAPTHLYVRPLEDYTAALARHGFLISRLEEPHPPLTLLADDPWWKENFDIPLFLLVQAVKGRPAMLFA